MYWHGFADARDHLGEEGIFIFPYDWEFFVIINSYTLVQIKGCLNSRVDLTQSKRSIYGGK